MAFANSYLKKHTPFLPHIQEPPSGLLQFIVVIPAYLEPDLLLTLESLKQTLPTKSDREVIILLNYSESESAVHKLRHERIFSELIEWSRRYSCEALKFHVLFAKDLPAKHAGAGLARKIGMDEALHRFNTLGRNTGFILSLDADTEVHQNYFTSIEKSLEENNEASGCIYQFAHPLSGNKFEKKVYEAAAEYELHMRYYRHIISWTGFPHSIYTIGSCFGVRADCYARHGGMNRRKAGEDFYFLHKVFPHNEFQELRDSCVYPSPRPSNRVPFGTGPTIAKLMGGETMWTYSPQAFEALALVFSRVEQLRIEKILLQESLLEKLDPALTQFLLENKLSEKLDEIRKNTASLQAFRKRFYQWFDAFKIVKFLNHAHTRAYSRMPVLEAVKQWFEITGINFTGNSVEEYLLFFRECDREGITLGK